MATISAVDGYRPDKPAGCIAQMPNLGVRRFSTRRCPACGGEKRNTIFRLSAQEVLDTNWTYSRERFAESGVALTDVFPIDRCGDCGFIYSSQLPDLTFLQFLYDDLIGVEPSRTEAFSLQSTRMRMAYLSVLLRMVRTPCRILDYGCGYGPTLALLNQVPGVTCVGYEPSAPRTKELVAKGYRVAGDIDVLRADGPFDVVLVDNVLEHIADPAAAIRTISSLCAANALLVVAVPEFDTIYLQEQIALHRSGKSVGMDVNPWEHLNYFDAARLDQMIDPVGFVPLKQSELPVDVNTGLRSSRDFLTRFSIGIASAARLTKYIFTGDAVQQATLRFYRWPGAAQPIGSGELSLTTSPSVPDLSSPVQPTAAAIASERRKVETLDTASPWFVNILRHPEGAPISELQAIDGVTSVDGRYVPIDMRPTQASRVSLSMPTPVGADYGTRLQKLNTTAPSNTYSGPTALRESSLLMSEVSVRLPSGGDVLDLGCGPRDQYAPLTHLGFRYVGIDYQNPAADIFADAHAIPFADASFDCVFSYAVLEHLHNPFIAIHEVARVLKPGGWFIGTVSQGEPFHSSFFHHTSWGILSLLEACPSLRIERMWSGSDTLDSLSSMGRYSRVLKGGLRVLDWVNRSIPWLTPRKMRWPLVDQRLDQMHRAGSLCFAITKIDDESREP